VHHGSCGFVPHHVAVHNVFFFFFSSSLPLFGDCSVPLRRAFRMTSMALASVFKQHAAPAAAGWRVRDSLEMQSCSTPTRECEAVCVVLRCSVRLVWTMVRTVRFTPLRRLTVPIDRTTAGRLREFLFGFPSDVATRALTVCTSVSLRAWMLWFVVLDNAQIQCQYLSYTMKSQDKNSHTVFMRASRFKPAACRQMCTSRSTGAVYLYRSTCAAR
jgi:hypothetical protein